jgi:hypothetical protein
VLQAILGLCESCRVPKAFDKFLDVVYTQTNCFECMMYVLLLLLLQVASAAQQLMVLLYVKHEQPYTFEHCKMVNNRF